MSDTEKKSDDKKDKKKFLNGWTEELETLAADWTDRAQCYRWMHDKSYQTLALYNQYMMIPVIILSTLAGTANFGLDTIFPDPTSSNKKIATLGIGSIGIITGIISTLANFFRYAQLSEAHSVAAISWAKFARLIIIELSLHPNERADAFNFLKMFRVELDRLIEQSPVIPEFIIKRFQKEFEANTGLKRPEITGQIEHTAVYDNRNERLKQVAVEATLALMHKKKMMRDLVLTDIDKRIHNIVDSKPYSVVSHRKNSIVASYIPIETKENKPSIQQEIQQLKRGFVGDLRRSFVPRQENKPDSFVPRQENKPDSFVPRQENRQEKEKEKEKEKENKLESLVQSAASPEQITVVQKIVDIDNQDASPAEIKRGLVGELKRAFTSREDLTKPISLIVKENIETKDQEVQPPTVTSDLQVILKE